MTVGINEDHPNENKEAILYLNLGGNGSWKDGKYTTFTQTSTLERQLHFILGLRLWGEERKGTKKLLSGSLAEEHPAALWERGEEK